MKTNFEARIRELTQSINGQFPRPWMTDLPDPTTANLFVVGKNQSRNCPIDLPGGHDRHIDALFNRNGQSCRALYNEIAGDKPSPTRNNTDRFAHMLKAAGAQRILETNVICYSSPMSDHLKNQEHQGGAQRGTVIFSFLLNALSPRCIIVHGAGTGKKFARITGQHPAPKPEPNGKPSFTENAQCRVYTIPSLAPPAFNKWQSWADDHLRQVAESVAEFLRK